MLKKLAGIYSVRHIHMDYITNQVDTCSMLMNSFVDWFFNGIESLISPAKQKMGESMLCHKPSHSSQMP